MNLVNFFVQLSVMKSVNSLKSRKSDSTGFIVRRRGRVFYINKLKRRRNARQA